MAVQIDGWSVIETHRKCNKPDCEICSNNPGHGPYYIGTKRVNGVKKSRYFGKSLPAIQTPYIDDIDAIQPVSITQTAHTEALLEALLQENEQLKAELDQLRPLTNLQAEYNQQAAQIEVLRQQNNQLKADLDQFRPLAKQLLADYEKQADQIKAQLRQIEELNDEIGRLHALQTNKQTVITNSPQTAVQGQYQATDDIGRALSASIKAIESSQMTKTQFPRSPFQR